MKILFVMSGTVFRINDFDSTQILPRQIMSSLSHIKLIKKIKEKFNLDSKILFNISNNEHNSKLYKIYKKYIIEKNEYIKCKDEFELIKKTLKYLQKYINQNKYEYIFFLRPDLYLKEYFIKNFKIDPERVIYTHVDKNYKVFEFKNFPSIWQCINLFPKKFFHLLNKRKKIWFYHAGADIFMKNINDVDKIDLFDNNLYYCNSKYQWNPMYIMSDRFYCNNIDDKILTIKRKKNKITFYEISNDINKNIHKNEEDFNELVNNLDINKYF